MLAFQTQKFGDVTDSVITEVGVPECGDNEILIKTHYVSINPIDWKTRKGLGWGAVALKDKLPWILGKDYSGEIHQVGESVKHLWSVGEKVCGCQDMIHQAGTFAQYTKTNSHNMVRIPSNVSLSDAAAAPLVSLTAWQALVALKIQDGEKLLICGGAGGVGHLAIQLAQTLGAKVYATSSAPKLEHLRRLGATAIDYNDPQQIADKKHFFDVIVDAVGGDAGLQALSLLKSQGRMVTLPTITAEQIVQQAESTQTVRNTIFNVDTLQMQAILHLLAQKKIQILIEKNYPFEQIADAQRHAETGSITGKIVVSIPH